MLLIMSNNCNVHNSTVKELEYILKIILLWEFKNYIEMWDRLPEHIKAVGAWNIIIYPTIDCISKAQRHL